MSHFFLFLDTETTGVPKSWDLPYTELKNWPSAIQVSWIICDFKGNFIKKSSYYIFENDLKIEKESFKIHGITIDFLVENGTSRFSVLNELANDVAEFKPLIIGHFLEFDLHTLSTDYIRAGLKNPFQESKLYCTMLKSSVYNNNPSTCYLRLPQLYDYLFNKELQGFHNAEIDVRATQQCFFEMISRNDISNLDFQKNHEMIVLKLKFKSSKQNIS